MNNINYKVFLMSIIKSNKKKSFTDKIKKAVRNERIALGLTQKEFSDFIGIKYATYRTFEQDGKISLDNFLQILMGINKDIEFDKFLDGFEFEQQKERARAEHTENINLLDNPIISPLQKQITLDKQIFGKELFYSVENGHVYDVSTFISIMLSNYNDERLVLLLRYFGVVRLKPYILKEKNIELLKKFNKHVEFLQKKATI